MNELELVLRNSESEITIVCEIYDNPLADIWLELLKQNIIDKKIFKDMNVVNKWLAEN